MRDLDLNHLSDTEFEEFTYDLLRQLKFVNVDWCKGTGKNSSPADRGRDTVAFQDRKDVDESRHLEKWVGKIKEIFESRGGVFRPDLL